jgi:hypothetical protein
VNAGSEYVPELGQLLFSNGGVYRHEMQPHVEAGLDLLGLLVQPRVGHNPCVNHGGPEFTNDTFTIRSYCWCDGEREGHEENCPPNFVCGDFAAAWYKHLGRGGTQSKPLSIHEWTAVMARCIDSLLRASPQGRATNCEEPLGGASRTGER